MSLILTRVDDRLIHGQIVEGWLRVIQAERIVVASDAAAKDAFQVGLMRLAVPENVALDVLTTAKTVAYLKKEAKGSERVLLLVPGVKELAALIEGGAPIREVNLGGVHDAPGRRLLTPHLSLSPEEKKILAGLEKKRVAFEVRALPTDEAQDLKSLFKSVHD